MPKTAAPVHLHGTHEQHTERNSVMICTKICAWACRVQQMFSHHLLMPQWSIREWEQGEHVSAV